MPILPMNQESTEYVSGLTARKGTSLLYPKLSAAFVSVISRVAFEALAKISAMSSKIPVAGMLSKATFKAAFDAKLRYIAGTVFIAERLLL